MLGRKTLRIALCAGILFTVGTFMYVTAPASISDPLVDVRERFIACFDDGERLWRGGCFRELATYLREQYTLEQILNMFAKLDDASPIRESCHALMHYIGQDAYDATGDLPGTFARCSTQIACGEGCFHGAVEGYMIQTGDIHAAGLPELCNISFTKTQINQDACTHGIGHALMLLESGEVPRSLEGCATLSDERARNFCYSGVFMENVFGYGSLFHPSRYLDPAHPEYPCTELPDEYGDACYEAQSSYVFNYMGGAGPAANFCSTVPKKFATACYGNIGGDIVVVRESPEEVRNACMLAPEGPSRERCYQQALLFRLHGTSGDVRALRAICDFADDALQDACDRTAGELFEDWYPGERSARCFEVYADAPERRSLCESIS